MTSNKALAIKIMSLLEIGMDASVEYHAGKDSIDFYFDYKHKVKCITIYNRVSDEGAQRAFDAIVKEINAMNAGESEEWKNVRCDLL